MHALSIVYLETGLPFEERVIRNRLDSTPLRGLWRILLEDYFWHTSYSFWLEGSLSKSKRERARGLDATDTIGR